MALLPEKKRITQGETCRRILLQSLSPVLGGEMPADRFLGQVFRENHQFGSRDRRTVSEVFYAFYRYYGWLRKALGDPTEQRIAHFCCAALIAAGGNPDTTEFFADAAGIADEDRIAAMAEPTPLQRIQRLFHSDAVTLRDLVPDWTFDFCTPRSESAFLQALETRPPVWLRLCGSAADQERALEEIRSRGLNVQRHPVIPNAWSLPEGRFNIQEWESYRRGRLELQDFSSQCIGLACGAQPGETWFDPCAGGGGKTLQLASMLKGKGQITASDLREFKLEEVRKRAARAGFRNIRTVTKPEADSEQCRYDGVLIDAPCSSSGRWRRNPENRWVITPETIRETAELQREILESVCGKVKPGGVLVYATCSVFHAENGDQIKTFLHDHPEFEPEDFSNPHAGGKPTENGQLQTWFDDADCDGSFAARLRRRSR